MLAIPFKYMLEIFFQLFLSIALGAFVYNIFSMMYLKGKRWSTNVSDMLIEDRVTSVIYLLTAVVILTITIVINFYYKFLIVFYLVSLFLFILGSSAIFPPKGKKINGKFYVMIYHIDNFIVTLNARRIFIRGKRLRGNADQVIFKDSLPKWLPPYENEQVSYNDYEDILNAVLKFSEKIGEQCLIE